MRQITEEHLEHITNNKTGNNGVNRNKMNGLMEGGG